jgi:hypothetical protein
MTGSLISLALQFGTKIGWEDIDNHHCGTYSTTSLKMVFNFKQQATESSRALKGKPPARQRREGFNA